MPLSHPFIHAPRLPSPSKRSVHSRSPSHSPVRQRARDFDPLLRDLSPSATLRAFAADPAVHTSDVLAQSIQSSSQSERALGARAAEACLSLRTWVRELEAWEWPGTFDVPNAVREKVHGSTIAPNNQLRNGTLASHPSSEDEEEEYWGSLLAKTVQDRENRSDEIGRRLDAINVEELKEYVLTSHYRASSRPQSTSGSIADIGAATDLKRLDDYTALITATILQALPYLSRLNQLMDIWTVRLIILRSAPDYLRDLKRARTELDRGWAAIAISPASVQNASQPSFDRATMLEVKAVIEQQVGSLGRRLDRFLDDLEGRSETVPDTWIDEFELLESAYGTWVVQAERKVHEMEWRDIKAQTGLAPIHEIDTPTTDGQRDSLEVFRSEHAAVRAVPLQQPAVKSREKLWPLAGPLNSNPPDPIDEDDEELAREVAAYRSASDASTLLSANQKPSIETDKSQREHTSTKSSTEQPARHDTPLSANGSTSDAADVPVKKRTAAFLNDIERTNSLKQSKSPVRPFEHASNAFTRLFKKDRSPEQLKSKRSRVISAPIIENKGEPLQQAAVSPSTLASAASSKPTSLRNHEIEFPLRALSDEVLRSNITQPPGHPQAILEASDTVQRESDYMGKAEATDESSNVVDLPSPFILSGKEHLPEDWPLASPPRSPPRSRSPPKPQTVPRRIANEDQDGSSPEMHVSRVPMLSDDFDRIFLGDMPRDVNGERKDFDLDLMEWSARSRDSFSLPRQPRNQSRNATGRPESLKTADTLAPMTAVPQRPSSAPRTNSGASGNSSRSGYSFETTTPHRNSMMGYLDGVSMGGPRTRPQHLRDGHDYSTSPPRNAQQQVPMVLGETNADDARRGSNVPGHSSPTEIRDMRATAAEAPRRHSQRRSSSLSRIFSRSRSSPPGSEKASRLQVPEFESKVDIAASKDEASAMINRTSTAATGAMARADAENVDALSPHRSQTTNDTPLISPPRTPVASSSPKSEVIAGGSRDYFDPTTLNYKDANTSPPPPPRASSLHHRSGSHSTISPPPSRSGLPHSTPVHGNSTDVLDDDAALPTLDSAMSKRQGKQPAVDENVPPPRSLARATPGNKKHTGPSSTEDSFDRHVSEVLEKLPSTIKFKARAGAETPVPKTGESRTSLGPRQRNMRALSRAEGLTIAPAEASPKKSSSVSEPDVKLYHLTQAGRDDPIKLYVRLVGENERVMVRVGGGWADLADYLRQYAEHHGSRTASEGNNLEVQTIASNGTSTGVRKLSGPADLKTRASASPAGTPSTSPRNDRSNDSEWLKEPQPVFDMGDGETSPTEDTVPALATPSHAATYLTSTPNTASRPSTADPASARPLSRQSNAESVGLAGAGSGRKPEWSEHKEKWVEGMLERAKKASAEKSREGKEKYFGELGKAGATRRVIFRSASASTGNGVSGSEKK